MNDNKKLFDKLKKYDDEYFLNGAKVVSQSIFGAEVETFRIENLTEDNAFSVVLFTLKQFNDNSVDEIDKKIFQDIWEFNQFKKFSNIISFFNLFPKNQIEITQSQFEYFYNKNELYSIQNEEHVEFYKYVKENIPHINSDLIFKDLINTINQSSFFQEQQSYVLQFNKLYLKNISIDLLNSNIKNLLNYFCSEENYSYYNNFYNYHNEATSYIIKNDNNNFSYVFYGDKIDKNLINQLFNFILNNFPSIIEMQDASKSYVNFKLDNKLISCLEQNKNISKI